MFGGKMPGGQGTGPLIGALAVCFLGAIAFAIPESPIATPDPARLSGFVTGHGQFSSGYAEVLARQGYNTLILDLETASLAPEANWRRNLDHVARRRFPVWGWIDPSARPGFALELVRSISLSGLFVAGPGAAGHAALLRQARPGLRVIPVVRWGESAPGEGEYAVAMDPEAFAQHAREVALPVLASGRLKIAEIDVLRAKVGGDCVVCSVAIPK